MPRGPASLRPGAGCPLRPRTAAGPELRAASRGGGRGSRDGAWPPPAPLGTAGTGAAREEAGTGGQQPGVPWESPCGREPIGARDDKKRRGGLRPAPAATSTPSHLRSGENRAFNARAGRSVLRICDSVIHAVRPARGRVATPPRAPLGCRPPGAAPRPALPLGSTDGDAAPCPVRAAPRVRTYARGGAAEAAP